MTRRPAVSILVPVRDEAEHLGACLASLRPAADPAAPVEVVVVDDRSADASAAIARAFAAGAPDGLVVRVTANPGAGKVAALNHAHRLARADAFVLLGGDDLLVPETLPGRVAAVAGPGPRAAMCRYLTFSDVPAWDGILLPRFAGRDQVAGGAISFNRAFADRAFPIPEALPNEDTWLRACCLLLGVRPARLDAVGLRYRIHAGNDTGTMRPFSEVDAGIRARAGAFAAALACDRLAGPEAGRDRLRVLAEAEAARAAGRWWRLLWMRGLDRADRAIHLANATPWLYAAKGALVARGRRR